MFVGVRDVNSGYIWAKDTTHDIHAVSPNVVKSPGGKVQKSQTFMFHDRRTGAKDVPMTNSGFLINMEVFKSSGYGVYLLNVSKEGAATRANGISSGAGGGGLIFRTIGN